jgi:hypothetical protein
MQKAYLNSMTMQFNASPYLPYQDLTSLFRDVSLNTEILLGSLELFHIKKAQAATLSFQNRG